MFHSDDRSALTRGFTLVELLVVIGIIALLISILLPSLSRARGSAMKAVCASNQRQLGIAITQYSLENIQFIPPLSWQENALGDPRMRYPYDAYLAFERNPSDGSPALMYGQGELHQAGLIDAPEIFYCPSMVDDGHRFEKFEQVWPVAFDSNCLGPDGTQFADIRTGYQYLPPHEVTADKKFMLQKKLRMSLLPSDGLMLHDITHKLDNAGHENVWNRLWADGSVLAKQSDDIEELIETTRPIDDVTLYEPIRAMLTER
ncbi:MAG: prepilin-type N-terminal cleavage/methylation domain-containing protein [Planctomycetota bacterium]